MITGSCSLFYGVGYFQNKTYLFTYHANESVMNRVLRINAVFAAV